LPNDAARRELLERLILDKVTIVDASSWQAIIENTHGLSGADLKRVVQDAKLKMASDIVKQRSIARFEVYLLGAIDALVESRKAYVAAVKRTFAVNADRPRWFNVHPELFEPNTRVHSNGE
jgi:SpoVK/Ycf46/Vps4 family AAA+-type ATPase